MNHGTSSADCSRRGRAVSHRLAGSIHSVRPHGRRHEGGRASALKLRHPTRRETHEPGGIRLGTAHDGGELALDVHRGAPPQLGGAGVLEYGAHVVVAVETEGRADQRRRSRASHRTRGSPWSTGPDGPGGTAATPSPWTAPKPERSASRTRRMQGDCLVDALAALSPARTRWRESPR